jgi:hypothetical protein
VRERFWTKVSKRGANVCWLWTGSATSHGYGQLSSPTRGKPLMAHRLSYELHYGPILRGQCVLHQCDNPLCVNPHHLTLGSKQDNSRQMRDRDRSPRGERHFNAKLNAASVRDIRAAHAAGASIGSLARQYHITRSGIADVIHRRTWIHVH